MKKILISLMIIILSLIGVEIIINSNSNIETIRINYYRFDNNYDDFNIWLWEKEPFSKEGLKFDFSNNHVDEKGAYINIDFKNHYSGATLLGIIIKKGAGWDGYREPGGDRFINVNEMEVKNKIGNVYIVEKDLNIGISDNDLANNIPDYRQKITSAKFLDLEKISIITSKAIKSYQIFEGENLIKDDLIISNNFEIILDNPINLNNLYKLGVTFENNEKDTKIISIEKLYDSLYFKDNFTYNGKLGSIYQPEKTTFRIWAPISTSVKLNLYQQGHPNWTNAGIKNDELLPFETYDLEKIENGAWEVVVNKNLESKYYTFTVETYDEIFEISDPYSFSTGANGLRSMVVNFNNTNPLGWNYNNRPQNITNLTDYIIYELHVRDLTSHSSWQGNENYRGKFMGFTEENTTFSKNNFKVSTGLDHLSELGINAVQLLPIFDFGMIDEIEMFTNENYNETFNWGYMPRHFNSLKGSYATNPFDGNVKIKEFKNLVSSLHKKNIRVIMDVVYNHTGESENSNFHKILPGYYHRMNDDFTFSNGSGTGNETASERLMMRKFMLDSLKFWAKEYNLSGFRFDLMALHDIETMQEIRDMLDEIDPTIAIYGEPWTGGSSPLSNPANKDNLKNITGVGAFNDVSRDAIKGSTFDEWKGAWIQNIDSYEHVEKIKYGITGGTFHPQVNIYDKWHQDPNKIINYVSAHDNNTLYDKLVLTNTPNETLKNLQVQANAIVLTSQGIPFIHAGAEIMRSKPKINGGYDENSYQSPDYTNQLRWDLKVDNYDVFKYYRDLIFIRKNFPQFRMNNIDDIISSINFINVNNNSVIAYEINKANLPKIIVIHSTYHAENPKIDLPAGISFRKITSKAGVDLSHETLFSGSFYPESNTSTILVESKTIGNVSLKEEIVEIEKGENFNPLDNLNYNPLIHKAYYSKFYDLNVAGNYLINLNIIDENGNFIKLEYQLKVGKPKKIVNLKEN